MFYYFLIQFISFIKKIFFYSRIFYYKNQINKIIYKKNNNNKIVSLLLAAGTSSRFNSSTNSNIMKQVYPLCDRPLISFSIEKFYEYSDYVIIITNTNCYNQIIQIINKEHHTQKHKIIVLINDINCRLESIDVGLGYVKNNLENINKVIIHDTARPFLSKEYIKNIITNTKFYSQYSLVLTNGLVDNNYNTLNRDNYFEICSPICIDYDLCIFVFDKFIRKKNRYTHEFIDILKLYKIEMNFIQGKYKYLKKITTIDDLE
jgi:2-C-methyl-D-erythritol 4-phosphate cytidylyltransferase